MDLDSIEKEPREKTRRSKTTLLVKNIPYSTKERELKEIFERYGELKRILISPFNTVAMVEYVNENQAQLAAKNLAYYKINYIMPIYLEFAPEGLCTASKEKAEEPEIEDAENAGLESKENR